MSKRDERLPPATRNYVMFGLLMVVALALAARDHFGPHHGRGESDSGLRLMVIGGSPGLQDGLDEVDGFSVIAIGPAEAIAIGRELLDEDGPAYLAAIAHADQAGCGFVVLDLEGELDAAGWGLDAGAPGVDAPPSAQTPFVVFSVGDLAPEGPRMSSFEPAAIDYEAPLRELDSVRLALYSHPDLQALWRDDLPAAQLQARQVLSNRDLIPRRDALLEDQRQFRELLGRWPAPGEIAGDLARSWEQVQAAPISGGVLVETRRVRPRVASYRRPRLSHAIEVELWFVPRSGLAPGLAPGRPDALVDARQRCEGLPERLVGEIAVAPDGRSLVISEAKSSGLAPPQLFVLDEAAASAGRCAARASSLPALDGRPIGRASAAGRVAWMSGDHEVYWTEGEDERSQRIYGVDDFSGPWWVDDAVLAMINERPLGPPDYGIDTILTLLDTSGAPRELDGARPLAELDAGDLFPELSEGADALIDLRPVGARELLLLTERCEDEDIDDMRPCLHRLSSEAPLAELTRRVAAEDQSQDAEPRPTLDDPAPGYAVETLGPLGPYRALAIAAGGDRGAWVTSEGALLVADLRGPARLEPRRVDEDALVDATPRISADARIVISEITIDLGDLGELSTARAFSLPALSPP